MLYLKIALRNMFRHKARLFLNMLLLVGAFTAIVVFKGFKLYVLDVMEDIMTKTQYGHVQVAKKAYWDNASVDDISEKMLEAPARWRELFQGIDGVKTVSARVDFYGLVNTESKSIPAKLIGFEPEAEIEMQTRLRFLEGGPITGPKQIIIGQGFRDVLKAKVGEDVTVVSPTLGGGINAMDVKVVGVFGTGFTEMDNSTAYLPLDSAQRILDSDNFHQLIVMLNDKSKVLPVASIMRSKIQDAAVRVRGWRELADLHLQVESFYNFQNTVIEIILLVLLILSVSNTMNMTVFERMGEIGTLRALGDYESNIRTLFFIETVVLGTFATLVSLPISMFVAQSLSRLNIELVMPMASLPLAVKVTPNFHTYLEAAVVCFVAITVAGIWPARKGSNVPIVEALRAKV